MEKETREYRDYDHALIGYKLVTKQMNSVFGRKHYELGKEYKFAGKHGIAMCNKGYHASPTLKDAVNWCDGGSFREVITGRRVFKVKQWGDIIHINPIGNFTLKTVSSHIQLIEEIPLSTYFDSINSGNSCLGVFNLGSCCVGNHNAYRDNVGSYNNIKLNYGNNNTWFNLCISGFGFNIGLGNSGSFNTGDYNEGFWNEGNYVKGAFNIKPDAPVLVHLFNKEVKSEDYEAYTTLLYYLADCADVIGNNTIYKADDLIIQFRTEVTGAEFQKKMTDRLWSCQWWVNAQDEFHKDFVKLLRNYTQPKIREIIEQIRDKCKELVPSYYDEKIFNQIFSTKYNKRDRRGRFCK